MNWIDAAPGNLSVGRYMVAVFNRNVVTQHIGRV